jgi:hypothetical protein
MAHEIVRMKLVDVQPGQIFVADWGLTHNPHFYLKVENQKAVNLTSYIVFSPSDQQEEVQVMSYNVGVYLWNGGLRQPKA